MIQKDALKLRTILDELFSFERDGRYGVAIKLRYEDDPSYGYEVHLYVRDNGRSGLLSLAMLAHAIEMVSFDFLAVESQYDLGTIKGEHVVQSWKIW